MHGAEDCPDPRTLYDPFREGNAIPLYDLWEADKDRDRIEILFDWIGDPVKVCGCDDTGGE